MKKQQAFSPRSKEEIMKILKLSFYIVLAFSISSVFAQQSGTPGKIHGHVINYTGEPLTTGIISLATDGVTPSYSFPVDSKGNYAGEAPAGTYTLLYRMPDTPLGQWIDQIHNVVITAGSDLLQNDDMARDEFIAELPEETKKQIEELKAHHASAQNRDALIKSINSDLVQAFQYFKDVEDGRATARKELSKSADAAQIDAKATSIRNGKYSAIESLMQKNLQALKDSGLAGDETPLLENLGRAQLGFKKYDDAERSFRRILEVQSASAAPNSAIQANAHAHLGEIYARTGKTAEAITSFDTAVQLDSAHAEYLLRTEASIFLQEGNAEAQIAAADKAIAVDPKDPLPWYIKANGLFKRAGIDPASKHYDLPDDCTEAYKHYLSLAPNGPNAAEAQSVLRRSEKLTKAER